MSRGRSQYFLQRDIGESGRGLQKVHEKSLDQQAGINKYRGIGRGLGTLGGILMAGSGAGIPLLALAGGLGSFTGSQIGKHLGQKKYGAPAQAERGGLFNLDVAEKQRESVGDYWKGMKEQIGVNTLQDAITAGMYGSQVQDFFQKSRLALGGQPAGMALPPSAAASRATIQQPDISGVFPDMPTRLKLPDDMLKKAPVYPTAADATGAAFTPSAFKSGVTTSAPSTMSQNVVNYTDVTGAEMLDDLPLDESYLNIDAKESSFKQQKEGAGFLDRDPKELGVQFGTDEYSAAIDANRVAISTDLTGSSDLFNQMGDTSGQITPSLTGNMQQRIAHYKNENWALDDTIDKTMWDAWSNKKNIVQQTSRPRHNFLNQAAGDDSYVRQSYNPRLQQQLLEKSKYFGGR